MILDFADFVNVQIEQVLITVFDEGCHGYFCWSRSITVAFSPG